MTLNKITCKDYSVTQGEFKAVLQGVTPEDVAKIDADNLTIYTDTGDEVTTYKGFKKLFSITTYPGSDEVTVVYHPVSELENRVLELETIIQTLLNTNTESEAM